MENPSHMSPHSLGTDEHGSSEETVREQKLVRSDDIRIVQHDGISSTSQTFTTGVSSETMSVTGHPSDTIHMDEASEAKNVMEAIRTELMGTIFLYRRDEVLRELQAQGLIATTDVESMSDDDLIIVKTRSDFYNRIREKADLSMIFGRASRVGLVRDASIGTWNAHEMEAIKNIVDAYYKGDKSLYEEIVKKGSDRYGVSNG